MGSGTGVAGIAAAILGATVVLTDQNSVQFIMEDNASRCCSAAGIARELIQVL